MRRNSSSLRWRIGAVRFGRWRLGADSKSSCSESSGEKSRRRRRFRADIARVICCWQLANEELVGDDVCGGSQDVDGRQVLVRVVETVVVVDAVPLLHDELASRLTGIHLT